MTYIAAEKKTGPMVMRTVPTNKLAARIGEGRGKRRNTNLQDKARMAPGVIPKQNPPRVADRFVDAAEHHRGHEEPCLVVDAEGEVDRHGEGIEGYERRAAADGRPVAVHALRNGAGGEGAVCVFAAGDVDEAGGGGVDWCVVGHGGRGEMKGCVAFDVKMRNLER